MTSAASVGKTPGQGSGIGDWALDGAFAHWGIGALDIGALGHRGIGALGHWGIGPLGHWAIGALGHWALGMGWAWGIGRWSTGAGEAVGGHGWEASKRDDPHNGREHPCDERRHIGEDVGLG